MLISAKVNRMEKNLLEDTLSEECMGYDVGLVW